MSLHFTTSKNTRNFWLEVEYYEKLEVKKHC